MNPSIRTQNLGRIYKLREPKKPAQKERIALKDINLEVQPGELFGLLGPNGAGKTTLIKVLTTLLAPSSGQAWVTGYDVAKQPAMVRPRINMVSGGESSGYGLLTVRENLWMFAQFYGLASDLANKRIKELLEIVGLADRMNTKSSDLSTGLRQKMNIVRGFLTDPDVLFLDEPTLGLDVGASREVRRFVRSWVDADRSRTLLLTTHYMVEAEELCDRVAIINRGQVLACDTPTNLKHQLQKDVIFGMRVSPLTDGLSVADFEAMPGVRRVLHQAEDGAANLQFFLEDDAALGQVISAMTARGVRILNFEKCEPTLEDVFVELVGQSMADVEKSSSGSAEA